MSETLDKEVRQGMHTVLLAKNYDGVKEINNLISKSFDKNHFYYVNRISFDEFLSISDDVIKISACLASPLNKLEYTHPYYEKLVKKYDYLEIQHHNHEDQVKYNQHLVYLSDRYNKPLIAGTDTHSSNQYKADCRKILLKAKNKSYGNEDSFDLTYKTYEELVSAYEVQNAVPASIYLKAIENTNLLAKTIESFEIDTSFKYPILCGSAENDKQKFVERVEKMFNDKITRGIIPTSQVDAFRNAIKEEIEVFEKVGMCGFMLSMSELMCWCEEQGIPRGFARGSVAGSRIAYITDITDVNPESWGTVFSRFCNEHRLEIGDIDVDVQESDRPKIFAHIIEEFGEDFTARVGTYGTCAEKGTIEEICRALRKYWEEDNPEKKAIDNPYSAKKTEKIKKLYEENESKTKSDYPEIFKYFQGLLGTRISQSVHPAGMVISPILLSENYGTFIRDGEECLMIDMEEIHEVSLVKYDLLILSNIQIIKETCDFAKIPYPKSHEINWGDQAVWKDMIKSRIGIFQMESEFAFSLLKRYEAKSIFDMSMVTAAIRPSGTSYRDRLISRIPNKNPSVLIDNLLKDNNGYLIYQEDTIQFLQKICGLSGGEADNVRRAIGRKDRERLEESLPDILNGYCKMSDKPPSKAKEEALNFIEIIEDSADYQFGKNHSIAYCMLGYVCAYLRYYYPYEFITAYLNNASNDDDIVDGTELAKVYGIRITPPKFGLSSSKYRFDRENHTISKGIASIKYIGKGIAESLFKLSKSKVYNSFIDLLSDITKTLDSRQLMILIKLDFFSEFGNAKELIKISQMYDFFKHGEAKTIKKEKVANSLLKEIIVENSTGKTKTGKEAKSYSIINMSEILNASETLIRSQKIRDFTIKEKIQDQLEFLGYIDIATNIETDRRKVIVTEIYPLTNKTTGEQFGYGVTAHSIGTGRQARLSVYNRDYEREPIQKYDLVYANNIYKNKRGYWVLDDYQKIG